MANPKNVELNPADRTMISDAERRAADAAQRAEAAAKSAETAAAKAAKVFELGQKK
ncbi:hypothetical protein [Geomonas sp.]|uniref:hypothetical protein n=1 Tax=Geomonas sp. TaxID=2651584 RepID=UPI002B46AB17|nr:hypothetical protein [Geomonas sp.]HJV36541.1 hypothetical protein [Geomonas sp.]